METDEFSQNFRIIYFSTFHFHFGLIVVIEKIMITIRTISNWVFFLLDTWPSKAIHEYFQVHHNRRISWVNWRKENIFLLSSSCATGLQSGLRLKTQLNKRQRSRYKDGGWKCETEFFFLSKEQNRGTKCGNVLQRKRITITKADNFQFHFSCSRASFMIFSLRLNFYDILREKIWGFFLRKNFSFCALLFAIFTKLRSCVGWQTAKDVSWSASVIVEME